MNSSNQSSKSRNEHCHAEICETPNRITAELSKILNYKNVLVSGEIKKGGKNGSA